jgi:hypothetical protein
MKNLAKTIPSLFLMALLFGCAGTRAAYQAADTLEDTAYVVAEHYAALVKEAADLRESGTLAGSALARVQSAEARARPVILRLQSVTATYESVRNATNEEALAEAVGAAASVISDFINALKGQPDNARLEANWTEVTA